jgi:hypothetical protein
MKHFVGATAGKSIFAKRRDLHKKAPLKKRGNVLFIL